MTVNATNVVSGPFYPNGETVNFPFDFEVVETSEVGATIDNVEVDPALFTVTLNDDGTGQVSFFTAPAGDGATVELYLFSNPEFSQQTTLANQGPYFQRTIETVLDRLAIRILWLRDKILRAPVIPTIYSGVVGKFPVVMPDGSFGWSNGTGADADLRGDLGDVSMGAGMVAAKDALNTSINLAMAIPKRKAFASQNGIVSSAVTNQLTALQAFLTACAAAGVVAVIDRPFVAIAAPATLAANQTLHFESGCFLRPLAAVAASDRYALDIQGDNVVISADGVAGFWKASEDRRLWAARVRGQYSNVTMSNVWCKDMSRVYCDTTAAAVADVEFGVNTPTHVRVIGGGVIFSGADLTGAQTTASDFFGFCDGFAALGGLYVNTPSHIQWWGGNAALAEGATGLERKCRNGVISDFQGFTCVGAGVWGSCGDNIAVSSGIVTKTGDVGIDFEGCTNSSAIAVHSVNAINGCFATFFLNDGIDFEACHGLVTDPACRLYATSNVAQSVDNMSISFKGGSMKAIGTLAAFGYFDGPCRDWVVDNVTFRNALIDLNASNNVQVIFTNNKLSWDVAAAGTRPILVDLGGHGNTPGGAARGVRVTCTGNVLRSYVAQPAETVGIRVTVASENVNGTGTLDRNECDSIPIPAIIETFNGNPGISNATLARDNAFDVALLGKSASAFTAVAATDVISHLFPRFETGSPVRVSNAGGALPAPLAAATTYYWIRVSQFTGKLAASEVDALAGTAIDLTTDGTGTNTMTMGASAGNVTTASGNLTFAGAAI